MTKIDRRIEDEVREARRLIREGFLALRDGETTDSYLDALRAALRKEAA